MEGQRFEQCELATGERDWFVVALQLAIGKIQFEFTEAHKLLVQRGRGGWCHGRRVASQHGMDTCQQFARIEGFGEVVISTHFQANDAVHIFATCGEHDDGYVVLLGTQLPAERQSVFTRQHQVQHQQIEILACHEAFHGHGIWNCLHGVTLLAQVTLEQIAQAKVVVDNQDSGFLIHR